MKTIKIIDLLNKIANGEEIPQCKLIYSSDNDIGYELYMKISQSNKYNFKECLNDEVEIIGENKEIERLFHCDMESNDPQIKVCVDNINILSDKINELIEVVNELKRGN